MVEPVSCSFPELSCKWLLDKPSKLLSIFLSTEVSVRETSRLYTSTKKSKFGEKISRAVLCSESSAAHHFEAVTKPQRVFVVAKSISVSKFFDGRLKGVCNAKLTLPQIKGFITWTMEMKKDWVQIAPWVRYRLMKFVRLTMGKSGNEFWWPGKESTIGAISKKSNYVAPLHTHAVPIDFSFVQRPHFVRQIFWPARRNEVLSSLFLLPNFP